MQNSSAYMYMNRDKKEFYEKIKNVTTEKKFQIPAILLYNNNSNHFLSIKFVGRENIA